MWRGHSGWLRLGCALLGGSLLAGVAAGQTTLRTDATLVLALVTTTGKELDTSLTAKDFALTDNGVPQTVTLEDETSRPLALWCSCKRKRDENRL